MTLSSSLPSETTPRPARHTGRKAQSYDSLPARVGYGAVGAGALLAAWQAAAVSGVFGAGLPSVPDTVTELALLLTRPAFWTDTALTIGLAAAGLGISAVIGILLGVLIGSSEPVRAATLAITEFLKPIPPIVVLPLAVMIFGPTGSMALVLVVIGCALAISIQTIAGVHDADPVAQATARSYGLGPAERLLRVTLPGALPFIGTAVRISAPASLVIVVVAGLLGGAPGLGRSIYQAQAGGNYATLYALVVVLGVLGIASQWGSTTVERRVLHWHPAFREVAP